MNVYKQRKRTKTGPGRWKDQKKNRRRSILSKGVQVLPPSGLHLALSRLSETSQLHEITFSIEEPFHKLRTK